MPLKIAPSCAPAAACFTFRRRFLFLPAGEVSPEEDQRPTLTGKPIDEEVREVLAQREALYREAAHFAVDAARDPDAVVAQILAIALPGAISTTPKNQRRSDSAYN